MNLSVCIPLKDRAENVKQCIASLDSLHGVDEIVIGDFGSTDTDFSWLSAIKTPVKVVNIEGDFSIGRAKNVAAENASGDLLFFLDADLIVPQSLIDKIHKIVPIGLAYAPIMHMQNEDGSEGEWAIHSFGQIAVTKEQWRAHPWVEWTSYGGDDNIFYEPYKNGGAVRDQVFGFMHQFHPNEERYKNYKDPAGTHLGELNKSRYGYANVNDIPKDQLPQNHA